jgi:hypothetical protein
MIQCAEVKIKLLITYQNMSPVSLVAANRKYEQGARTHASERKEALFGTAADAVREARGGFSRVLAAAEVYAATPERAQTSKEINGALQMLSSRNSGYDVRFTSLVGTRLDSADKRIAGVFIFEKKSSQDYGTVLHVTVNAANTAKELARDIDAGVNVSILPNASAGEIAHLVDEALVMIEQDHRVAEKSIMTEKSVAAYLESRRAKRGKVADLYA